MPIKLRTFLNIPVWIFLIWLNAHSLHAQTTNYLLGATTLVESAAAGADSVVLAVNPSTAPWTASTNAGWLHLSPFNQSGTGSTNVIFTFDANSGATRSNTLTIAGLTLNVIQAGPTYVAAESVTMASAAPNGAQNVVSDYHGNLFYTESSVLYELTQGSTNGVRINYPYFNRPQGLAADTAGNIYIADAGYNEVFELLAGSTNVVTLVSSGLNDPSGVAVDGNGNVYITDSLDNAIKEWSPITGKVTSLITNIIDPYGITIDCAGNLYFAVNYTSAIMEWIAANNTTVSLFNHSLSKPSLTVDGSGNLFFCNAGGTIEKWTAASNSIVPFPSSPSSVNYVTVDKGYNVYAATAAAIITIPYCYVDPTARKESSIATNDALPVIVPSSQSLSGPFAPTNNQSWLSITGVSNGIVSFMFTTDFDAPSNRTSIITLLGQSISITQTGNPFYLATNALLVGPTAGVSSIAMGSALSSTLWTAVANASWLHFTTANQSGLHATNVVFSYDANPGGIRSGTATVGGELLTITQAGSTYTQVTSSVNIISNIVLSQNFAVDSVGNIFFLSGYPYASFRKWTLANNQINFLPNSIEQINSMFVDGKDDLYCTSTPGSYPENGLIEYSSPNYNAQDLVTSGLLNPYGITVDTSNNVYIADSVNNAIKEWIAATGNVITLVSTGLASPNGVVFDKLGNLCIADSGNNVIKEYLPATSNTTTIVTGLTTPVNIAADTSGNFYMTGQVSQPPKEWIAATGALVSLFSTNQYLVYDINVDSARNIYIIDYRSNYIAELPYAFVDATPKLEKPAAGTDTLPMVLPASANLLPPFAPTSDQSWLTIGSISGGVVNFSFTANIGSARTAHINLLGQIVTVMQTTIGTPPLISNAQMLANGSFQFGFTSTPSASFTVLASTNLALPLSSWTVAGTATDSGTGVYQFTAPANINASQMFYEVTSP